MEVYVNANELSSSQLRKTCRQIEKAQKKISSVQAKASGAYGYGGRLIFANQLSEIKACCSEIKEIETKLEKYANLLDTAPDALIDVDAKAKKTLVSSWEKIGFGVGSFLGVLPNGVVKASSGDVVEVSKILESNDEAIYNHVIDSGRDIKNSSSDEKIVYGSKNHKIVSGILPGNSYEVTTYTDYKRFYASERSGDDFYKSSLGLSMQAQHFDIISNDGTEIAVDVNSLNADLDGEFDLAKGNAYAKAGLEYDLVKADLVDYESEVFGVGVTAKAGVGAHANVGIHSGKFTVDVGAAFIGGVSIKLEVDYKAGWNKVQSIFD